MGRGKKAGKTGKKITPQRKGKRSPKKPTAAASKPPLPYRFLEHTADIMIEAEGKSYLDALQNVALGMFSVLGKSKAKEHFEIDEQATNREELVVYALSHILSECDARGMVPCKTEVLLFDGSAPRIRMRVWGEVKNARDSIKAVTFHELAVLQDEKTLVWKIRVLFDV